MSASSKYFWSRRDGFVLDLSFVLEDAQGRYVVFDLLKTRQHSLAIVGDGLIVRSDGLVGDSPAPPYVEESKQSRRPSRPAVAPYV